jgi:hypothetical protein
MWLVIFYHLNFFSIKCVSLYESFFIVLCKIDFCLTCCYSILEVLNQNLNLKFHQMDFWVEFFNIHMNEKITTCHDYHGFK